MTCECGHPEVAHVWTEQITRWGRIRWVWLCPCGCVVLERWAPSPTP